MTFSTPQLGRAAVISRCRRRLQVQGNYRMKLGSDVPCLLLHAATTLGAPLCVELGPCPRNAVLLRGPSKVADREPSAEHQSCKVAPGMLQVVPKISCVSTSWQLAGARHLD